MARSFNFPKKDYHFEIDGVKLETRVAEEVSDVESFLTMLRTNASSPPGNDVLGFDVKLDASGRPKLLLLCNGSLCLIIKLSSCGSYVKSIFENEKFFCVGINVPKLRLKLAWSNFSTGDEVRWCEMKEAVDSVVGLSHFASLAFQNLQLENYVLHVLGSRVGVPVKHTTTRIVFTNLTIEEAFYDVYYSYVIGRKSLDHLMSVSGERYIVDLFNDSPVADKTRR